MVADGAGFAPSVLPDISPSRGEIDVGQSSHAHNNRFYFATGLMGKRVCTTI
ncbi:hypothetical protein RvVAT039_05180 [Agrobacterium vitis]|nr:hypothetical protein RvVAT039_05180 [Agrobacterium vitis]